jgi:ribonuclease BN (tRNA processing enzyme)
METEPPNQPGLPRRKILALPAALAAVTMTGTAAEAQTTTPPVGDVLHTLGTSAGPPPEPNRFGMSSAISTNGRTYLVDCGRGSVGQFTRAGLTFDSLAAMFITHLHADHIMDYYAYFLSAGFASTAVMSTGDGPFPWPPQNPVQVYGPGPAHGLPPSRVGDPTTEVGWPSPTPGIVQMTDALHHAYAYSSNIFNRDAGIQDIRGLVTPHDIRLPDVGASFTKTAPTMDPFQIYGDDNVTVSAILVPHYDVFPSFAFRFDLTSGRSVTFSGDTVKSHNVVNLARGTDILVHEAIFTLSSVYHQRSHTAPSEVGEVATAAGAKQVILSHYTPANLPDEQWQEAIGKTYSGPVAVAHDGQSFTI